MFCILRVEKLFFFSGARDNIHKHSFDEFSREVSHFASLKFYRAGNKGKESVIFTTLDVLSGMVLRATLADDDVADCCLLSAVDLDT